MVRDSSLCPETHAGFSPCVEDVVPTVLLVPYLGPRQPENLLYKYHRAVAQTAVEAGIPALARLGESDSFPEQIGRWT